MEFSKIKNLTRTSSRTTKKDELVPKQDLDPKLGKLSPERLSSLKEVAERYLKWGGTLDTVRDVALRDAVENILVERAKPVNKKTE